MVPYSAGVCSRAPGITGRAHLADPAVKDEFHAQFHRFGEAMRATKPDAVIVIAAEHFANFFMNNMPAYAIGMAEQLRGPDRGPEVARHRSSTIPGDAALSQRLIREVMQTVDVAYAEEWKFDHGIMVPLDFLARGLRHQGHPGQHQLPGPAAHAAAPRLGFRRSAAPRLRQGARAHRAGGHRRHLALAGHADSSKVNAEWDAEFMRRWCANDREALLSLDDYGDEATYREAGQGGFEIRTFLSVAAAARGQGEIFHMKAIPIFAVTCTAATMSVV